LAFGIGVVLVEDFSQILFINVGFQICGHHGPPASLRRSKSAGLWGLNSTLGLLFLAVEALRLTNDINRHPIPAASRATDVPTRHARRRGDCAGVPLEWSVLDWNAPAIAFYESLGSVSMDDWRSVRS
jgi:hypothetical protein